MAQYAGETKAESVLLDRLEARINARSLTLQAMRGRWSPGQRMVFLMQFKKGTDKVVARLDKERVKKLSAERVRALEKKGLGGLGE